MKDLRLSPAGRYDNRIRMINVTDEMWRWNKRRLPQGGVSGTDDTGITTRRGTVERVVSAHEAASAALLRAPAQALLRAHAILSFHQSQHDERTSPVCHRRASALYLPTPSL